KCLGALNLATETVLLGGAATPPGTTLTPEELAPHFPQLEIIECLGRGGMGVVYKARQKSLNRLVALKLLAPERVTDAQFAERFTREALALAALNHPSIVTIHDFGQAGGFYFLLMEFVDGVNLRQAMKAGRFTPEQALAIVPPVCEALQYAHEHGIVHRDIKPENLLLDKDGRVKIADFGIAKMLGAPVSERAAGYGEANTPNQSSALQGDPTLASVAGTPQYMAPEQKTHRATDHRADIYSLGVVLYEMLTGELPAEKLRPPSRRVQVDVRIDEIVLRALEKTPELRYQTAVEFRTQVEARASATPPHFHKVAKSTLTTPEQLATVRGQFFIYRTRGELVLDDRQLSHTRASGTTVIPLAAIRDVSIGQYPRSMAPMGIDLLSVAYEEGGQRKQVLLSPMEGSFAMPGTWNARAAEWATAVREAVTAATGRAPTTTPSEQLGVPGSPVVLLKMFLMLLVPLGVFMTVLAAWISPATSPNQMRLVNAFAVGLATLGFFLLFMQLGRAKSPPGSARSLNPRRIVFGLLAFSAVLFGLAVLTEIFPSKSASVVSTFTCIPVGVSNNVVIVDVTAEVGLGSVEIHATLDGPKLSQATEAALGEAMSPPFAGTLVKPTTHVASRPWRVWSAGLQTWRLGFVLPDAALAKEAFENLRPIGPLTSVAGRTHAGILFEVGRPGGETYSAGLEVTPPVGSNDANWVSVSSAMSTYNESGVIMNWEVLASQPGTVVFQREGRRSTASLKPDTKTKFYRTAVSLGITKIGTDRVLLISQIGGVTAQEELSGSFRDLSAELLRYKNMSAKTVRGEEIELCQFQGKPVTVQVDALPSTVTTRAKTKVNDRASSFYGVIALCVIAGVVALLLLRKGWSAGKVMLLVGVPLLIVIAALLS
ncbi:MAG: serine/threonine-protein kinase, partial [Chthoniobacteraceae bacterium]